MRTWSHESSSVFFPRPLYKRIVATNVVRKTPTNSNEKYPFDGGTTPNVQITAQTITPTLPKYTGNRWSIYQNIATHNPNALAVTPIIHHATVAVGKYVAAIAATTTEKTNKPLVDMLCNITHLPYRCYKPTTILYPNTKKAMTACKRRDVAPLTDGRVKPSEEIQSGLCT
jgi:hypothetical protein